MAAVMTALVVIISGSCTTTEAYAFGPTHGSKTRTFSPTNKGSSGIRKRRPDGSAVTLYLFPTPPSVSAASHGSRSSPRSSRQVVSKSKTSLPAMSESVLSPGDTLPSFHTAHGLLSPEVFMRIADTHDADAGGPVRDFLKTYRKKGPMACLPMLSDPCVLPELTKAMRDIA